MRKPISKRNIAILLCARREISLATKTTKDHTRYTRKIKHKKILLRASSGES